MKKIMILVMVAAFVLPTMAQSSQDFQSTSTMKGVGSGYEPQLTAVGAATVTEMATTTESYSPAQAPSGPRRIGPTHDEGSPNPIGDAILPLLLMAMAFAGITYFRKRQARA